MKGTVRICVPSWRRPEVKTLEAYPECAVYIDPADEDAYREANPDAELVVCPEGVQGNLCRVRNYILDNEFNNGAAGVLLMDDDFSYVGVFEPKVGNEPGWDIRKLDMGELAQLIGEGFQLCFDLGYRMWGINLTPQPVSYRRSVPFHTNRYIGGPFQAFLPNPLRYDERLPLKEDYDMTLQQCREYGGVLRMDFAFPMVRQAAKGDVCEGGCSHMRNSREEKRQFELLQRKWGSIIVRQDRNTKKEFDYNPRLCVPIAGI